MAVGIAIIVVFFALIITAIIVVIVQLKKTNPNNIDAGSQTDSGSNAKDFILMDEIGDYYIDLGLFKYRSIIEVGSLNIDLMNDTEQEIVEVGFHRFLNSLTYPISIYVLTRVIDLTKVVNRMKKSTDKITKQFPITKDFSDKYINRMGGLANEIGHTLQKKKYIVIPYDEAINMSELNNEEKKEYGISELRNRTEIAAQNLSAIGMTTKILGKKEIFEVLYSVYHRDNYLLAYDIVKGKMSELFVDGDYNRKTPEFDTLVTSMISECHNVLHYQMEDSDEAKFYKEVEKVLNNLQSILIKKKDSDKEKAIKKLQSEVNMLDKQIINEDEKDLNEAILNFIEEEGENE